jgi:cytochrome b subunit of formate dehydrogenase
MPTSVAIYVRLHAPINFLKLYVFGSITFGVFIILSGLVVGLSGTTPRSIRYTKMITIAALAMMLILFTIGLYRMFHSKPYHTTCGATCSVLIRSSIVEPRTHARQHSPPTLSTPHRP